MKASLATLLLATALVLGTAGASSDSWSGSGSAAEMTDEPEPEPEPTTTPSPEPEPEEEDLGGSMSGSAAGETESTTTPTAEPVPEPEPSATLDAKHTAEVKATIESVGKAPTKAQLRAQMEAALPAGSTVVVVLVQKATIPLQDDTGAFCGANGGAGSAILNATEKGTGVSLQLYENNAWKDGCSIAAACEAVSGRRRLGHVGTHTQDVKMATVATDDVSQHVTDASFATSLKSNIETVAPSLTIPAIPAVDHASIAYTNEVTYNVESTDSTAVTSSALQGHVSTAVTQSLIAAGFNATEAATMATATVDNLVIASSADSNDSGGDVSGASAATAVASLAAACAAALALF